MIKLLGFALYGPLAASTRYRLGQYIPGLAKHGINLEICHLLDDDYLRNRFRGSIPSPFGLLKMVSRRLENLRGQEQYDLAMLHCELFPLLPGRIERALIKLPYIYDFDDAFFLKYRSPRFKMLAPVLSNKFDTVIAGAAAVTAGNNVLAGYAKLHNVNTGFLPTVVDTLRYLPARTDRKDMFTVGWIGSPSTAVYLSELIAPLTALAKEGAVRLVVIGGKAPFIPGVTVVELPWSEASEIELINFFDVGVMPLPDDDWARGKCAFKLIQYMACAVPVVASRVGANIDVVDAECGLLASNAHEWLAALRFLRDRQDLCKQMGEAGRERVVQHYSLERNLPVLAEVIHKVVQHN